jgi:hypothetical protein
MESEWVNGTDATKEGRSGRNKWNDQMSGPNPVKSVIENLEKNISALRRSCDISMSSINILRHFVESLEWCFPECPQVIEKAKEALEKSRFDNVIAKLKKDGVIE